MSCHVKPCHLPCNVNVDVDVDVNADVDVNVDVVRVPVLQVVLELGARQHGVAQRSVRAHHQQLVEQSDCKHADQMCDATREEMCEEQTTEKRGGDSTSAGKFRESCSGLAIGVQCNAVELNGLN